MSGLRVFAKSLRTGRETEPGQLLSLKLEADLRSPVVSLHARFAVERQPDELREVRVADGMRTRFEGQIDRQRFLLSGGGRILELEARSAGALLLDNEAMPCVLTNVRLSTVFSRCIAPHGFTCYNPQPVRTLDLYTIRKGMSEWEALTGFARRVYGITPYVTGRQVMVARPNLTRTLRIGDGGVPYRSLVHTTTPYHVLSQVVLRDENGQYSTTVRNSSAAYLGVRRKRYIIPTTEFVGHYALDANQRIRRSMLAKEETVVQLPGIIDAEIGQQVVIHDSEVQLSNLLVGGMRCLVDDSGVYTELVLISSVYYE